MTSAAQIPAVLLSAARRAGRIAVLTGAGMSAESGVPTFRDAQTGWWARFDPAELATPQAWQRDPDLVWGWYLNRIRGVRAAQPNAGHRALARWGRRAPVDVVTQNVDDLHERAGSRVLAHLHGALTAFRCDSCATPFDGPVPGLPPADGPAEVTDRMPPPRCAHCPGQIRPGVVWFGEALPPGAFDDAADAVRAADLVLVVGTSGLVFPASTLPDLAQAAGVPVVEINPEQTDLSRRAEASWRATAAVALPALVDALYGSSEDDRLEPAD